MLAIIFQELISERLGMFLHIANLAAEISFPAAVVWIRHPFPGRFLLHIFVIHVVFCHMGLTNFSRVDYVQFFQNALYKKSRRLSKSIDEKAELLERCSQNYRS